MCCPKPQARLILWPGRARYSGPSLELDMHSGSVPCLGVGDEVEFTMGGLPFPGPARTTRLPQARG
ncbi:hypothetical protein [Streptomyces sp. BP-8]|uniref:Uncharacterized protein n=1 Tax=Streptomyces sirii TaxID=3127701 RepID=A0ABZ2QW28_9ACTN